MMATLIVTITALSLTFGFTQETLEEKVKANPNVPALEVIVNREFSPTPLSDIVGASGLIFRGTVIRSDSEVADQGRNIVSHVALQVLDVTKGPTDVIGTTITLKKLGGRLKILQKDVTITDADFPPMEAGSEYILFAGRDPVTGMLSLPYGAQSAFEVRHGSVRQVSEGVGLWNQEYGILSLAEFVQVVRKEVELQRSRD